MTACCPTRRCSRTNASVAALPLAFAAKRQYRWTDEPMTKAMVLTAVIACASVRTSNAFGGSVKAP